MDVKKRSKRADARRARVGANRKKTMEEQRVQRLGKIASALKKCSKIAAVVALAAGAWFVIYTYSPKMLAGVSDAFKSGKGMPQNIRITNCDALTQARLARALEHVISADTLIFDRAAILNAAAAIPEIEKVGVKKTRNRSNKEAVTQIRVTERKPVALVHDGGVALVDKRGMRFAVRPGQHYDLPMFVVGKSAVGDTVDLDVFNAAKKAARRHGADFFRQMSQIDFGDGASVRFHFKTGEAEYIVHQADVEHRMIHIKKLRERLLTDNIEHIRVDMRYRGLAFASAR